MVKMHIFIMNFRIRQKKILFLLTKTSNEQIY